MNILDIIDKIQELAKTGFVYRVEACTRIDCQGVHWSLYDCTTGDEYEDELFSTNPLEGYESILKKLQEIKSRV